MCGIIGYTGKNSAVPYLLKGLYALEYRGYDSAGIAITENGEIGFCKCKGNVENLESIINKRDINAVTGIGHTRWATHGEPSTKNAHPHLSENRKFAVVHNGIIENCDELKNELSKDGYTFKSDTDTEVISHLMQKHYNDDPVSAILSCTKKLKGSYALAVLCGDCPDKIICIRHSSPLVACVGKDGVFVASDSIALSKHSDEIYKINENCPVILSNDKIEFFNEKGEKTTAEKEKVNHTAQDTDKNGYEHYMLKEINEQSKSVNNTVEYILNKPNIFPENLSQFKKVHIIACGSAYHVALTGKYAIESYAGMPCECHIASEFRYSEIPVTSEHLCIIISQSGETADSLAALKKAKQMGAYTLGVVNVPGSSIATESDRVIYTKAGIEIAVATTKAYSAQLCAIYLIAAALSDSKVKWQKIKEELAQLPQKIKDTINDTQQTAKRLSERMKNVSSAYFIGRNTDYPTAMEGALKMKEISYIHCEAYAAGELKHGTISLIENGTVVVAVMTNERLFDKMLSNVKEVQSRGADVIFITKQSLTPLLENEKNVIAVPDCDDLISASVSVIPLQLMSYYTAKLLGCDIDKPRNLAKSVTVE